MEGEANLPVQFMNVYNRTPIFASEVNVDENEFQKWLFENWTLSFWYSAIYVVVIFSLQSYMKNRQPFQLRPYLILWSAILAIFSILGSIRAVPELYYVIRNYGLEASVCDSSSFYHGAAKLWPILFTLSKAYELGDTLFIVLRKQNLIFLHWYHHVTVMIYTWYTHANFIAAGRWFVDVNFLVHAFMYSYYTLKAMRFRLPKWLSMILTTMQISQMVVGMYVNYVAYTALSRGDHCDSSYVNIKSSVLMYLSYFLLFSHFFYNSYVVKKTVSKPKGTKSA